MELVYSKEKSLFVFSAIISFLLWFALIVGTLGIALMYLLMGFIFYLFAHSALISYLKGTAVKITPEQFPDLHERIVSCCRSLNVKQIPEAYLLHGDGIFNAFATRFLGRNFIALYSDVVDALEPHPGAINFYIGHELGHIQRGHLKWAPILFPSSILPVLGAAYSRAREYTCDRFGFASCENSEDATSGLAALAAGSRRWRSLNKVQYASQANISKGFWMSFHELTGDYPWLVKRMATLNALASNTMPKFPRRNIFAWLFSLFVPRVGIGGGAGSILVTVAIIGIIAAISIPAYLDTTAKAQVLASLPHVEHAQQAVGDYAVENKAWPKDNDAVGIPVHSESYGKGIDSLLVEDGIIKVTFSQGAVKGKSLILTSDVIEGKITWQCYSKDIQDKYLPEGCK